MKAEAFERRSASKWERRRRKRERETKQPNSSGTARPGDAPPPRRPGHVNRSGAEQRRNWWPSVPSQYSCYTSRCTSEGTQSGLSVCLGVAWSPRPDTCAQRDGCSVEWLASHPRGLRRYWPARASWGVTRPISGRCVSRRGLVFLRGFRHFSGGGSTHVQNSPFRNVPGRAEPVCIWIHSYKQKVIVREVITGEQ